MGHEPEAKLQGAQNSTPPGRGQGQSGIAGEGKPGRKDTHRKQDKSGKENWWGWLGITLSVSLIGFVVAVVISPIGNGFMGGGMTANG